MLLVLSFLALGGVSRVGAGSEKSQETKIKAAFTYNFIRFVDWPKEKQADVNEPIIIGIIGSEDFTEAFEPIKGKRIKDRSISIKYFAGYEKLKKSNNTDDSQWDKKNRSTKNLSCADVLLLQFGSYTEFKPDRKSVERFTYSNDR